MMKIHLRVKTAELSFHGVIISGRNGAYNRKLRYEVINFSKANVYSRYCELATITIDHGIIQYYAGFIQKKREEFLAIVQDKYPEFFEYLLFHPEYTK